MISINRGNRVGQTIFVALSIIFVGIANITMGQNLRNIEAITMQQEGVYQLRYHFDGGVDTPQHYYDQQRKMLVLDFKAKGINQSLRDKKINNSSIKNIKNIYAQSRIRSTVNLDKNVAYSVSKEGNTVEVIISDKQANVGIQSWNDSAKPNQNLTNAGATLQDVGFSRNSKGEGVVELYLPTSKNDVSIVEESNKIRLKVDQHVWDPSQIRRIQVTDFATPVSALEVVNVAGQAYVDVITQSSFKYRAQQIGDSKYQLVVSPNRVSAGSALSANQKTSGTKEYTGELITINFQDIDVRAVLQIIADFTGLNIVVSDKVNSRITIRLQNVPWDQALETVLMYTGLGQARQGNIIFIAPQGDLSQFEAVNLEHRIMQLSYSTAKSIADALTESTASASSQNISQRPGLSQHGSVGYDERTNQLIISDTTSQMKVIEELVAALDIPVRQVQISAQIVAATDDFSRDLGVKWGVNYDNNRRPAGGGPGGNTANDGFVGGTGQQSDLGITLGATGATSIFKYMVLGKNVNMNLEVSAMQEEGRGETLSNPVILTTDRQTAYIKQGAEIAYSTSSNEGTNVEFKEMVMELNVTPQITPDNKIIMDILITKDEPRWAGDGGEPGVDKKELKTQALVSNGETIVLGGIYEHQISNVNSKVPFFGDLPFIGNLFKKQTNLNKKVELLIFVTPNIIDTLGY